MRAQMGTHIQQPSVDVVFEVNAPPRTAINTKITGIEYFGRQVAVILAMSKTRVIRIIEMNILLLRIPSAGKKDPTSWGISKNSE